MLNKFKKAVGPVVAISLLMVVTVVSVVTLGSWYTTFSGDLSGQDFSTISVSARTPEVATQLVEVTKGEAAYDNVSLDIVSQNAKYHLSTDVTNALLTVRFGQQLSLLLRYPV